MDDTSIMADYSHLMGLIREEHELVLPGEKRLELKKGGRAWRKRERQRKVKADHTISMAHNRKMAQDRYYRKNKDELNKKRSMRNSQPSYVYYKAKKRAEVNGVRWDFTFDTWTDMWLGAPKVRSEATGFFVTAWSLKGSNIQTSTQMHRKELSGPWSTDNCHIIYLGEEFVPQEERFEYEQ
jgi:hypothetical protein